MEWEAWLLWAQQVPLVWGVLVLALCSGIEYVFPPFPGDTVTVLGAMLMAQADWPAWAVFGAVMAGSVLGAAFNWLVGRWLVLSESDTRLHRWLHKESVAKKVEALTQKFERHGSVYIALNRFLPAFRSLFFLVAGMANISIWRTIFFASLSAALWNAALLGVGYAVGFHFETLLDLVRSYSTIVLTIVSLVLVVWVGRFFYRERSLKDRNLDEDGL